MYIYRGLVYNSKFLLIAEKLLWWIQCEAGRNLWPVCNREAFLWHLASQGIIALTTLTNTIGKSTHTVGHTSPSSGFKTTAAKFELRVQFQKTSIGTPIEWRKCCCHLLFCLSLGSHWTPKSLTQQGTNKPKFSAGLVC